MKKAHLLEALQEIPGVGKVIANDLWDLEIRRISDLRNRSPEMMYEELCQLRSTHIDRCMLYVFRCAHYYATETDPDPERLQWWKWKD